LVIELMGNFSGPILLSSSGIFPLLSLPRG
jgi:hypothetical protein